MANRIKGITVQIGGDTTGLDKALKGVNSEIKNTQSQLKDVERLLKLDPGNVQLLEQKHRLLGDAVSQTTDKLKSLKDAEKQAQDQFKKGEISQQQYDGLQREIAATEQELKKLEDAAKNSNVTLTKVSQAVDSFTDATAKAAQKTKGISAVAGGAVAGLAGMAVKAGVAADDLNTLAKQSGFGTDEIQKWQYAADRMDVSSDTIIKAAQKMKKNMNSTSAETIAAWDRLDVSLTQKNGNFRNATDVFYEAIGALSRIPNETERDVLAMQIFGKSADELAGIVDDGGAALKEMGEEAEASGLILSQDALDDANAFNDGIDTLKAKASAAFMESGAALAEKLLPLMDTLVEKISGVLEWLASLDGDTIAFIGTLAAVVAGISPVLTMISKVNKALDFLIANPLVALVAAIVALVAAVAINGDKIQEKLQKVDDFLQNIFAKDWTKTLGPVLGGALNKFFDAVKGIWDGIKKVFDGIIDFIRGVFTGDWKRAWNGVKEIFGGIFHGLVAIAKVPLNAIIGLVNGAISGINLLIRGINHIPGVNIGEVGKIPYLAKGGVVHSGSAIVGEAGPELLTVAGGAAQVTPLTNNTTNNSTHLGGVTLNVYGAPGQNVNELADIVMDRIQTAVGMQEAAL